MVPPTSHPGVWLIGIRPLGSTQGHPRAASSACGSLLPLQEEGDARLLFQEGDARLLFHEGDARLLFHAYFSASVSEYFQRRRVWSSHRQIRKTKVRQETALGRTQAVPGGVGPGSGRLPSSFSWLKFPQPEFGLKRGFPTPQEQGRISPRPEITDYPESHPCQR